MESNNKRPEDYIRNLYVYPTHAVLIPPPLRGSKSKTVNRVRNESNLKQNRTKGVLSPKARKRLVNAVNWLLLASKKKRVKDMKTGKWFEFRICFVTLTVPTTDHDFSDEFFKKKVLHNFLSNAYSRFGLRHYVWKCERNKNGNIHFHLTTDTYIHYEEIRRMWNSALAKFGLIESYGKKFRGISQDEYLKIRSSEENYNRDQCLKAFKYGVESDWSNPNSTDVHSVKNIKDLGAYLADYMAKKEMDKEPISGRIWACSYSLSTFTKNETEMILTYDKHLEKDLFHSDMTIKDIESVCKKTGIKRKVGALFLYKMSEIGRVYKAGLKDIIFDIVYTIRCNGSNLVMNV